MVRDKTVEICRELETEDYVVQPHDFISPPKWHLAHTTWLFETFCLKDILKIEPVDPSYHFLFNSYYESQGEHVAQNKRGIFSRPTVREIFEYRKNIDNRMHEAENIIANGDPVTQKTWRDAVELGLQHEQQHQELLYMDIKYIFSLQKSKPALSGAPRDGEPQTSAAGWLEIPEGIYEVGWDKKSFAYDNELPRHREFLQGYKIRTDLVTNDEFAEFIADGGYLRPELWLSDGWQWVKDCVACAPLYWTGPEMNFTLQGEVPLEPQAPVSHVSYFEADAFARWKKCRLPTEGEWEVAFAKSPRAPLWQWTQSAYLPYPKYKSYDGSLMEYNSKFMSGQMVLRGGCLATPTEHYRFSYRNFFYPRMRWMFSGIRLCTQ